MDRTYPRGEPRPVQDPDAAAHDEMIRLHRAQVAQREAAEEGSPPPRAQIDGRTAAIVDILGSARRARTEWEEGNHAQALIDGLTGAADIAWGGALLRGLAQGNVKITGPHKWRTKPSEEPGVRKWMGEKGLLQKGQHGHHGIIPNNGWGKIVPDAIKNQPWNIKGMESPEVHGRIHGNYKDAPRYGVFERYLRGTPDWWKSANVSALGNIQSTISKILESQTTKVEKPKAQQ